MAILDYDADRFTKRKPRLLRRNTSLLPAQSLEQCAFDRAHHHRAAALATTGANGKIRSLPVDCFAEFIPTYEPGLATTAIPNRRWAGNLPLEDNHAAAW